jgi:hypothetical protein
MVAAPTLKGLESAPVDIPGTRGGPALVIGVIRLLAGWRRREDRCCRSLGLELLEVRSRSLAMLGRSAKITRTMRGRLIQSDVRLYVDPMESFGPRRDGLCGHE